MGQLFHRNESAEAIFDDAGFDAETLDNRQREKKDKQKLYVFHDVGVAEAELK